MRRSIRSRKRSYLGCLSPEIMLMVSAHLDAKDHANLCLVSRSVRRFFMHINLKSVRFDDYPSYLGPSLDAFMNPFDTTIFNRMEDARPDIKHATIVVRESENNPQPLSWSTIRDFPQSGSVGTRVLPQVIAKSIEQMPNLLSLSLNLKGLSRIQEDHFRNAMHATKRWEIKYLRITDLGGKNIVGSMIEHCTENKLEGLDIAENCYTYRAMDSILRKQPNIEKFMFRRFVRPGDLTCFIMHANSVHNLASTFPNLQWLGIVTEMKGHVSGVRRHLISSEMLHRVDAFIKALAKIPTLRRLAFSLPPSCLNHSHSQGWGSIPGLPNNEHNWGSPSEGLGAAIIMRMSIKLPHIEEIYVFNDFPSMIVGLRKKAGSPMRIKPRRVAEDKPSSRFPYGVIG